MKGRKPTLRVVGGTDDNISAKGKKPLKRCPAAPSWLSKEAMAEWRRAAPDMHTRKLLTNDVLAMLESYCVAAGLVRECEMMMQKEGRTLTTEDGVKVHPAFRMQNSAMREARLLAAELGLTPHRRLKGKEDDKGESEWSGLLA